MTTDPTPPRPRISFVLPVYNEEKSLEALHGELVAVLARLGLTYEIVFVDDGSRDGSYAIINELARRDPRVRAVRFRRNFGKAAAYQAGFQAARGELVATMDSDLQDDPEDLPLFLAKIDEGFDLVSGWKHTGKGKLERSLPSKLFNRVVRRVSRIDLHDFNCPFKVYRREVVRELDLYGELHRYIPVLAHARGFSIAEIKIKNRERQHGSSKYGWERYLRGMLDLMTVTFITRFANRPMHLLALAGFASSGLGFAILGGLVLMHFAYRVGLTDDKGWNFHDRPIISLAVLAIIVGLQFLSMGLLAELFVVTRRTGDGRGYSVRETIDGSEGH